ncbi:MULTISPECIES: tetratricopeptide repeat protein [Cyanophyceae]|uniref:tetratricopeptide repeat protein n=1 Tax=Cyanophyceae TaxID=3028117 RepID=UPI0016880A40|nr:MULTISPECIES: tetratricopeptide repeat protein [unclassified Phormidium]MBD1916687.1 tetratricopeptide repeat protein [Phormidium sp. FACHB-77]MBD2031757.1 tetratricopeptide repeat protein [Phormidium sp. FACHB-322]MBD2050507.1 tetratricopeptide repeat protein [Leptolyngbya sp. FACHB-60]
MADNHWLTRAERALVVGSGVGAVASIAAQNIALASAPLTVLAAVGILNRNRVEQQLEEAQEKLARQHRQTGHRLTNLSKQVTAMPSPEALTNFQRAVMERNNHSFIRLAKQINGLKAHVDQRIEALPTPDLTDIHQQIAHLQEQSAAAQVSFENLNTYIQRLATTPRVEAAENKLSQVKTDLMQTRVSLENLRSETRILVTNLQDALGQIDRRWQEFPQSSAPGQYRSELGEVVKAMAALVPQSEFSRLVDHVKDLTRQQTRLEQALTKIPVGTVNGLPTAPPSTAELERLTAEVQHLQQQVNRQETAGQTQEQVQQVVSQYLGQVKAQVAQLEGVTRSLSERQQQFTSQLVTAPDDAANRKALMQLARRVQQTETEIKTSRQEPVATAKPLPLPQPEWIIDLPVVNATEPQAMASRHALETALRTATRRVLLVWPWASYVTIDDSLLEQFRQLLDRGGQLEIGWCHRGDQHDGRLAWRISQRWGTESSQLQLLKASLNQLLPLRENYPDRFKFRIMGTAESYLVCDSGSSTPADNTLGNTYAIVSLKALPTQSAAIPDLDAKLRTAEPAVVHALMQRFHNPTIPPGNTVAFFNRGTTRHDLRDQPGAISDYSQVINLQPDHAIALNNRGVAQLELNQAVAAEADLSEAILQNGKLFAPLCNRGWLRLEQRRYAAAIADFTQAIALKPHLPIAYVYRGSALQKLGDLKGAVRDYSDAIACGDPIALPYCYRSAAYQSQGDQARAIADLERASAYLEAQGDRQGLSSVQRTLSRLQSMTA